MSYLVDALKKAERERHASQTANLHAAASMSGKARHGMASPWRWLIAILLAGNVALVLYIWRPHAAAPTATTATSADAPARPASGHAGGHDSRPGLESAQAALLAATPNTDASAPPASQLGPSRSGTSPARGLAREAGGSVVYSTTPLTNQSPSGSPGREARATDSSSASHAAGPDTETHQVTTPPADDSLPTQSDVSVPQITINGELYSSMPGRSFILVNGRTYHEGERLAAGPAVEQIEPNGAILNYQGQRYRVSGPG